jgi:hypothetical protein
MASKIIGFQVISIEELFLPERRRTLKNHIDEGRERAKEWKGWGIEEQGKKGGRYC